MKHHKGYFIAILIFAFCLFYFIWHISTTNFPTEEEMPELVDSVSTFSHLPDTIFPSALLMDFEIKRYDTLSSGALNSLDDLYLNKAGVFTFRGGITRNYPNKGRIVGSPSHVETGWVFSTPFDTVKTKYGQWGGGTGWTGQPLLIKWPDSLKYHFAQVNDTLIYNSPNAEVIFASLCGDVFFLNPETGKPSRSSISIGNTLKGTPSLDPSLNGLLYVGHGVPRCTTAMGITVIDLFSHKKIQFISGQDPFSWKNWGAFDSSPIAVGQFLFWPGENGLVYKFLRTNNGLVIHSVLRYRFKGNGAPGIESSIAVFKNYGYFGDNHGNIICLNLNNMKPVWHFHNVDDNDATIVIEEEGNVPYLYAGSQVDRQGDTGVSQIVKLNGLNGKLVWKQRINCRNLKTTEKKYDGGMFSTPLLGEGNCSDFIFCIVSLPDSSLKADMIAFEKDNGDIKWKLRLDAWSWSSPVPFYNEHDSLFIFTGDVAGNLYIIEGTEGKVLFKKKMAQNFESSPLVMGSSVIVGSRGRNMYKFSIK